MTTAQTTASVSSRLGTRSPVLWWAGFGAVMVGAELIVLTRWVADRGWRLAQRPAPGAPGPGSPTITHVFTACWALVIAAMILWIIRDCRRSRRLSFPAVVVAAALLSPWLDLLGAARRPVFAYYADNPMVIRSWSPYLPGWRGGDQPVTDLLAQMLIYYVSMPLIFLIMREAVRYAARRRPHWGLLRLSAVSLAACTVCGAGLMFAGVAVRLFAFVDVIPELTLFHGTRFQYPLYDALLLGVCFAAFGMLWYRQDGHGLTAVERGADRLPTRYRTWARILAMTGTIQLALLAYGLGHVLLGLAASPAPAVLNTPVLLGPAAPW
ncbi:spirocyclase AveC family protein [Streptomyces klenkii]|uniref:spirocyclase AveC family protein n=1 Tax=Streptomyces klenkii TaxID=1420899 RepID=UPI0033BF5445